MSSSVTRVTGVLIFKSTAGDAFRGQPVAERRGGSLLFDPSEAGGGAALENTANNSSLLPSDKRNHRISARYFLWDHSHIERVRLCGRRPHSAALVALRLSAAGRAGYAGLQSCGSVWADPVCNAKIMARRALEIGGSVEAWQMQGGRVGFVTFTLRHKRGQRLHDLWDVLSKAWAKVTSGKSWVRDQARGVEGWLRVVEVTYGANGWHVHIHALLFLAEGVDEDQFTKIHRSMVSRWIAAVIRLGLDSPLASGQDARLLVGGADAALGAYLTKSVHGGHAIGLEFTHTQSKGTRSALATRSVWSLLDDAMDGLASGVRLWAEWERVSKGKRQLTWSKGLRQRLRLGKEASDEDVAAEELGTADDDVLLLTSAGWSRLVALRLLGECLTILEVGGLRGVKSFLDRYQIDYQGVDHS